MNIKRVACLFLIAIFTFGCDHPKTQDALRGIEGSFNEATKHLGPAADGVSALTTEQINKLALLEYKVIPLPSTLTPSQMESILAKAGEDRWECFSAVPSENGTTVFCRRFPYVMLREALKFM